MTKLSMRWCHKDNGACTNAETVLHQRSQSIENLTADNFDESLEMLEPLLINECVGEICDDYMGMIFTKAENIGKMTPKWLRYAPRHRD